MPATGSGPSRSSASILDPDIFTKIIYVVVFAIVLIMLVTKLLLLLKI
jgi:hypothetical protein